MGSHPATSPSALVDLLANADPLHDRVAAEDVAQWLRDATGPERAELRRLLEERRLWSWVRAIASDLDAAGAPASTDLAAWMALDALGAFFTCDYDHAADRAIAVVNMPDDDEVMALARTRALTVLGYTRDVAGDHTAATGWYNRALKDASSRSVPGLLIDLATSLSKQGRYDDSLDAFDRAAAAIDALSDEEHAARLRVQALSRRAVVSELMGNARTAIDLQQRAIELACSVDDSAGAFTARLRLVRHLVAAGLLDEALSLAEEVESEASQHRNGELYAAHDLARVRRARSEWALALRHYAAAVAALPDDPHQIVRGNLDVWLELLTGMAEVADRLEMAPLAHEIRQATVDARTLADARGIYRGAPLERARLVEHAARSADALRERLRASLLHDQSERVETEDFIIDLHLHRVIKRGTGDTFDLSREENELLRYLAMHASGASREEIWTHLRKHGGSVGESTRLRYIVAAMKKRLKIGKDDLVIGTADRRGGYRLSL